MIKFNQWLKNRLTVESVERDPFARQEVIGKKVDADGETCDWCGSEGKNGKLNQYSLESDGGRSSAIKGKFCSKSCRNAYHGK